MIGKKISVHGIAVKPGISRNGILYSQEELDKFAPTMLGKPILKDHANVTDGAIGKITQSISNQGIVSYGGWIKEDGTGICEKIEDGRISEVSIGAFCKRLIKESEDSEYMIAEGLESMELSTTPCPGNRGTSIGLAKTLESKKPLVEEIMPLVEGFKIDNRDEIFALAESYLNKINKEVIQMAENAKTEEQLRKEIEEKVRAEEVAKKAEEARKLEEATKLETAKREKIEKEVREKLSNEKLEAEKDAKLRAEIEESIRSEDKKANTKGMVSKTKESAKQEEDAGKYVVENSALGMGYSIFRMPKADGTY